MFSVQVQELSKAFNRKNIFINLSFTHQQGVLGIAGSNGSGKSTLMKCLAFLLRPGSGTIEWMQNHEPVSRENVRAEIGYMAPYINLYDDFSVFENVEFILSVGGYQSNPNQINTLLRELQLLELKDQYFKTLSTGQRQRVKLASALVRKPKILFLDEPGSNLDEKGTELVSSIIQQQKEQGTLIFLASNDPVEINLCDELITLGESNES